MEGREMTYEQLDALDEAIGHIGHAVNLLVQDTNFEWDNPAVVDLLDIQAILDDILEDHEPPEEEVEDWIER